MFKGGGGGYILVGMVVGVYLGVYFVFMMTNMGLCVSVKVSFICNLCLLKLYMWNHSSVVSD
jgi:hypothetical protein